MNFGLNIDEMKENLDSDMELLFDLISGFLESAPDQMADVRAAIFSDDPRRAATALHTLKGTVAIFCAHDLLGFTRDLEMLAKQGELGKVVGKFDELNQRVTQLSNALRSFQEAA